jgi:sugar phosphate isomerase/epimerase
MREYLPLSVKRLGNKIRHFHLRDGDSMFYYALPCGAGTIDWEGFLKAVKDTGFDGTLSFEMGGYTTVQETIKYIRESKEYIEKAMDAVGISLEGQ